MLFLPFHWVAEMFKRGGGGEGTIAAENKEGRIVRN